MNKLEIISNSESDTFRIGEKIGAAIDRPFIIFLSGTLGAGKTRFVQALASGLGIDSATVNSPTFTIMVPHTGRLTLLHVDAYRLNDLDEADQLGIDDWVEQGCVLVVEWAEKIEAILPPADLKIQIEQLGESSRQFKIVTTSEPGKQILLPSLRSSD